MVVMVRDHVHCAKADIHEKIDITYLMSGNCVNLLKCKTW